MSYEPMPGQYTLPQLKSADVFELLVRDCLNADKRYVGTFARYGRSGQDQSGIDLYSNDWLCVVQCKNYLYAKGDELKRNIKKDYRAAIRKFTDIKRFIIATATRRDNSIQYFLYGLQEEVEIEILFWDDFEDIVHAHQELISKYFSHLLISGDSSLFTEPQLDRPVYWINTKYGVDNYWFDDCHPFLLGNLLLAASGRGIFFLISKWPMTIGTALNQMSQNAGLPFHWLDLELNQLAEIPPEESGTILTVRESMEDAVQIIIKYLQDWQKTGSNYQLIFNYCFDDWQIGLLNARQTVRDLYGKFPGVHIDLLSMLDPFLNADNSGEIYQQAEAYIAHLCENESLFSEADLLRQMHKYPSQCKFLLQIGKRSERLQMLTFCISSHSFSAIRIFMEELQPEQFLELVDEILMSVFKPDWDICAWEVYRRCKAGQNQWKQCLESVSEYCSDSLRTLINTEGSEILANKEIKSLFYLLQDISEDHIQTFIESCIPDSPQYIVALLCSKHGAYILLEKLKNEQLASQYRSLLVPQSFNNEDEMTVESQYCIRPTA